MPKKIRLIILLLAMSGITLFFCFVILPYPVLRAFKPCGWFDGIFFQSDCVQQILRYGSFYVTFTPDKQYLYSNSGGTLFKFRLINGSQAWSSNQGPLESVALSPDGNKLALALTHKVWIEDANNGQLLATFPKEQLKETVTGYGTDLDIQNVVFSPDNRTLAISAASAGVYKIYFWQFKENKIENLLGEGYRLDTLTFSPDGTLLVGTTYPTFVWDVNNKQLLYNLAIDSAEVAFSPQGSELAIASSDGLIHIFQAKDGQPVRVISNNRGQVYSVTYSPDGQLLASGDDCSVRIWQPDSGKLVKVLDVGCFPGHVKQVRFSPDDTLLVVAQKDNPLRIFRVPTLH